MAYISQEEKQAIAPVIKALLKQYGLKGSLSVSNHSTIVLTLTAGAIDFFANANRKNKEYALLRNERPREVEGHMDVNVYWYEIHFDGVAAEFLGKAIQALRGEGWYDKSDIQSDYFNVKHYVDIRIGKWNKPYILQA
jgi:hypothetical protein